jgi:hypothetical protein
MKFKTLMTVKAVVALCFGPPLLLVPAWLLGLLGLEFGSGAAMTAREYGAAMIGILLMTWLARGAGAGAARTAITWNLFVYDAIGLVFTLVFLLQGVLNPLGWGIAFIYLFFAAGFGCFALRGEKAY